MKKLFILCFCLFVNGIYSQSTDAPRCLYKEAPMPGQSMAKEAEDFTITTTDGITRNLYNTLDSGKTVFIDLFYTTCTYCQIYAPVIEEIYLNTGAGQENIEFWGISNNLFDTNHIIDAYKEQYGITNPCAGPDGGGTTAFSIIVEGQNFYGFPTYCVICPDRTLFFDPVYPPTVTGFDPYFDSCATTIGIQDQPANQGREGIFSMYPNPANDRVSVKISLKSLRPVTLQVISLMGEILLERQFELQLPEQTLSLPVDGLMEGTYVIRLMQDGSFIDFRKLLISSR